ncbi:MAG: hypothetical protein WCG06_00130 [Candidatus Omnitrophota bacterium]
MKRRLPQRSLREAFARVFIWVGVPCLLAFLAFNSRYMDGMVDYNEAGDHLVVIGGMLGGQSLFKDIYALYGPFFITVSFCLFKASPTRSQACGAITWLDRSRGS